MPQPKSNEVRERIDSVGARFDNAWKRGERLRIEEALTGWEGPDREQLFESLLARELSFRRRVKEQPSVAEYQSRFPEFVRQIAEVFASNEGLTEAPLRPSEPAVTTAATTRKLGRFELQIQVGEGAFGAVWKARDTQLGRTVAVKLLHQYLTAVEADRERFYREARASAQLRHPGIVPVHEVTELEGQPAIISSFVEGVTLKALLEVRKLEFREAAIVVADVANALDYAHSLKLVHRDVKPANIMVEFPPGQGLNTSFDSTRSSRGGASSRSTTPRAGQTSLSSASTFHDSSPRPLLLDFGLSLRDDVEATMTADGQIIGTPAYMSPEQAKGEGHSVDRRSDVYSLGVVLYELLVGEQPFRGSKVAMLHQVIHEDPRRLRLLDPTVPRDLETICLKAMAKSRAGRYATAGDFAADLRRWLNDEPILARRPTLMEQLRRWMRRHPAIAAGIAAVFVMLALFGNVAAFYAVKMLRLAEANDVARRGADAAREREAEARQRETKARRASEDSLREMYTAFGMQASDNGQPALGVPWFVAAAESLATNDGDTVLDHTQAEQAVANQLRFRNWSRVAATPVRALMLGNTTQTREVRSLLWHPGGRWLLVQGMFEISALWDVEKDVSVPVFGSERSVRHGQWSPDGKWLALGTATGELDLLEVGTWQRVAGWSQSPAISALAFNQDGHWLAVGSDRVRVWDCERREFIGSEIAHPGMVTSLSFNESADKLVTACADGLARIFRVGESGESKPLFDPVVQALPHSILRFAPRFIDKDRLLMTQTGEREITSWMMSGTKLLPQRADHADQFGVSSQGRAAVAFSENEGRQVNLATGERFGQPMKHTNHVFDIAFRGDEQALATPSGDRSVKVWSTRDGRPLFPPILHQGDLRAAQFSPNGHYLATAQLDGLIRVWSLAPTFRSIKFGVSDGYIELSHDGRYVMPGPWQALRNLTTTQVFELPDGKPVSPVLRVDALVNGSYFAPDGQRAVVIAAASVSSGQFPTFRPEQSGLEAPPGQLIFWNWRTGEETSPRLPTPSEPIGAAWSPDSKMIAVICAAGQVLLIDANRGELRATADQGGFFTPYFVTRRHVCFAPDGRSLVTWVDAAIRAWDSDTLALRYGVDLAPAGNSQFTHDVVFSPDGQLLAIAGSDQKLRVIDHATGQPAVEPLAHPDWVFNTCFSPDGKHVLTACRDGMARLWDWRTAQLVCPALAHKDEIFSVAITPNGRWLLTAGRDSTVRIWDAANGKPITPPLTMPGWIYEVRVTPDGNFALASGVSDSLYVFDLQEFVEPDSSPLDLPSMKTLGEIIAGQTLHQGGVVNLTTTEWLERWQRFRDAHPGQQRFVSTGAESSSPADRMNQLRTTFDYQITWGHWSSAAKTVSAILADESFRSQAEMTQFRTDFEAIALYALTEDQEKYRATCREMLARFDNWAKQSPHFSEQLAKSCLLSAGAVQDLSPISALAEHALNGTEGNDTNPWFVVVRALAHFRQGEFPEAQSRLALFFKQAGRNGHLFATALAMQAMIQQELGDVDAARQSLQQAQAIVFTECPQPDQARYFYGDWSDWVRCLTLVREAERVVQK